MNSHFATKIFHRRRNLPLPLTISPFSTCSAENPFYRETFFLTFQECTKKKALEPGRQTHARMIVSGSKPRIIDSTCLLQLYLKCSRLECAAKVFDRMSERNFVTWTTMLSGYLFDGKLESARSLFDLMPEKNVISWNSMMFGYVVNGEMRSAQSLFDLMPERSVVSWNSLISGYLSNGNCLKSIGVFVMMGRDAVAYDEKTFAVVLKACSILEDKFVGIQVHGALVKSGFECGAMAGNATMHMYVKCRMMDESLRIFDAMPLESRDAVSWTAAIAASVKNKNKETLSRFLGMLRSGMEPRTFTYTRVLYACASRKALKHGREIHGRVIKCGMRSNSLVSRAMIDMYCKCGNVKEAVKLHERMKKQKLVSWNAIISGYSSIKKSKAAQSNFLRMLERGVKPGELIFDIVLRTCSDAELGKQIHAQIIKRSMQSKVRIMSTLAYMYSKCGNLQDSVLMFRKAPNRYAKPWTNMVHAHARLGDGNEALQVFEEMVLEKVRPKRATFVGVLRACADIGLVDEAFHYLNLMKTEYGLQPRAKHYSCLVDALGRSGRINDALKLTEDMPLKADYVIWTSLLSNCKMHGDVKVAEIAASSLLELNPRSSAAYVLLSQTYADAGMWDEASTVRRMMRSRGLKKKPGRSKIVAPSI